MGGASSGSGGAWPVISARRAGLIPAACEPVIRASLAGFTCKQQQSDLLLFIHSPRLFTHSPGLLTHSPGLFTHSPGLFTHSPRLFTHSPRLFTHLPRLFTQRFAVSIGHSLNQTIIHSTTRPLYTGVMIQAVTKLHKAPLNHSAACCGASSNPSY